MVGIGLDAYLIYKSFFRALWSAGFRSGQSIILVSMILVVLGIAYVIAIWFALVAWTFRDIESRSKSVFTQVFSTLLVVLFFIPGLVLYLILRPKETLDQTFQRTLEEEYLLQDLDDLLAGGDHTIAIGQVVEMGLGDGDPLVWFEGRYRALRAGA